MLEFNYQAYTLSGNAEYKHVHVLEGTVNLVTYELAIEESSQSSVKVRRTPDNVRVRPNGHKRHNPFDDDNDLSIMQDDFIENTDLEWMSLNYRKRRAAMLSNSKRRLILAMFQKDISYFPSLLEIRDQLINA